MRRLSRLFALICLCLMTYGTSFAQRISVNVILTDSGPSYREVADAMRGELERGAQGAVQWETTFAAERKHRENAPRFTVTIGRAALASALDGGRETTGPIMATLLPRLAFEREVGRATARSGISAIVLDQPPSRQIALIRASLPQVRRIGMLVGPDSRHLVTTFRAAAQELGLSLASEDVDRRGVFEALRNLLDESDVLLAVPDPSVYSDETIAGILNAGYRRRIPMVGFSPAYVKAGALVGLYATPAQVGRAAATAVREYLATGNWPSPTSPPEYTVRVNEAVAKSLELDLTEDEIRKAMRQTERRQ